VAKIKAGVNNDGTLVAVRATPYRLGGVGQGSQAGQPYAVYRAGESYREVYSLHTNEDSSIAMRAPGHPQASFAMELLDDSHTRSDMDPVAFRKRTCATRSIIDNWIALLARSIGRDEMQKPVAPGPSGAGWLWRGNLGGGGNDQCKVNVTVVAMARCWSRVSALRTWEPARGLTPAR